MARPRHRTHPGATYFVTTNTWQRRDCFRKTAAAEIVVSKLLEYRDRGFYLLHRYVVMPDHLHVIVTPGETTTLEKAVGLIKGGSSFEIGRLFQSKFPVWHEGFTEHQIRDQADYESHVSDIDMNPVKKSLVERPADYTFGSAGQEDQLDPWSVASGAKALS